MFILNVRIGEHRKSITGGTSTAREDMLCAQGNEKLLMSFPAADLSEGPILSTPSAVVVPLQNNYTITKAVYRETTAVSTASGGSSLVLSVWNEGTSTGGAASTTVTTEINTVNGNGIANTSDLNINFLDVGAGAYITASITDSLDTGVISMSIYCAERSAS